MRGISTVVDATVFLLLVGGAIATLVGGTGALSDEREYAPAPGNPAAENARLLSTTTATVNYSLAPAARSSGDGVTFRETEGVGFQRSAHGTLASLVADATVGNATFEGRQLSHASEEFERNLSWAVRSGLGRRGVRTSVRATWEPYEGAPMGGSMRVGDEPPRDVDVHASTLTVESGVPASRDRAVRAAEETGYEGVARVVSDAVVRGLFPPNETRLALRGGYPVDALTAQRYRRTADALDAGPPGVGAVSVEESNDRLRAALTRRFAADLADRYDSPGAAARAVETDAVEITVRTWSP